VTADLEARETETIEFRGPAGRIEAIVNRPVSEPAAAAVICHAHPLHGGMMHFKVIFRAAKALRAHGVASLRFNFRGVGRSEGTHDHGRGELDDTLAALGEAARRFPGLPLFVGGFSFGSSMACLAAARDARVRAVLVMGYPITRMPDPGIAARVKQPRLFVQGERDEFGDGPAISALVEAMPQPRELVVIPSADHFFTGRLDELQACIEAWAARAPWSAGAAPMSPEAAP
jgi:hypothetical protein